MVCTPLVTEAGTVVGIVCGPTRRYRRFYGDCGTCRQRRAQVRRWDGIHYGYTEMCLGCGTFWQDGIACGKPDRAMARRWWNEAEPAAKFDAWVREQERSYFDEDEDVDEA